MAAGPYDVDGVDDAGTGTEAAVAFLDRLPAVAADHPVVALPYGDVDADALDAAGLTDVVVRSLPGPHAGRRGPAGRRRRTGPTRRRHRPPVPATARTPPTRSRFRGPARESSTDALDVEPRTDIAWAADGRRTHRDAGHAAGARGRPRRPRHRRAHRRRAAGRRYRGHHRHGAQPGGDPWRAAGRPGGRPDPRRRRRRGGEHARRAPAWPSSATWPSWRCSRLQAPARHDADGPRRTPARRGRRARGCRRDDGRHRGPRRGCGRAPSTASSAGTARRRGRGGRTARRRPVLDPAGLADITAAVATRDDLAGAVVGDADSALQAYDAGDRPGHLGGLARRPRGLPRRRRRRPVDPGAAARPGDPARAGRRHVQPGAPATPRWCSPCATTCPSPSRSCWSCAPRQPRAVDRRHRPAGARARAAHDAAGADPGAAVRRVRGDRQLTTPSGGPLGDRISLQVKSTAYGSISLLITIGAAVLLGLLFLRRLVNFVLRRRRAAAAELGAPEGTTGAPAAEPEPGVRAGPERRTVRREARDPAVDGRPGPPPPDDAARRQHRMPPPPPPRRRERAAARTPPRRSPRRPTARRRRRRHRSATRAGLLAAAGAAAAARPLPPPPPPAARDRWVPGRPTTPR